MAGPTFQTVKTPFTNMTWTPDVPASALQPNEYNTGYNVETDVRSVKTVSGEEYILTSNFANATEKPIFVTGGFRNNNVWWYIVATIDTSNNGRWYGINAAGTTNLTPGYDSVSSPQANIAGYSETVAITASWNGTILFINDGLYAPMYLVPTGIQFQYYDAAPDNYDWNYNAAWSALTAGFMRIYSTPNVGSILIAGNLTATVASTGLLLKQPYTIRWSQAFGIDSGPTSWQPTTQNVANELEVPLRGPAIDGFPCNGNFYIMSYWDTVVLQPFSYQSTSAPILGVRLHTQGRGLLNENCWAAADGVVYGVDARDLWVFNGTSFKPIGDQRVKNWFYDNLNDAYADRTFVINNTDRYQIEFYFADQDSTGWPNKMISYRYDLDVWNPPRDVYVASHAAEGPRYQLLNDSSMGFNDADRRVVYSSAVNSSDLIQKDEGTSFVNNTAIDTLFRRDNISFGQKYSNQILLHRCFPEITGTGNVDITVGGQYSTGSPVIFKPTVEFDIVSNTAWVQINQNDFRQNTFKIEQSSTTDAWQLTAINWQITVTEDSR
jgi:hypothetical protein